ncbi:MAG: flippase-like domain-containing protein [Actinobacteria bacterium]|nr:MAG: flippase-like domain-containing protein [Actinomycetota bacterium]
MVAVSALAAYALITELADIGFDTIANQLGGADWSWVVIAFVLAQLTNVGEYVSLTGMVARPVPFAPTIMFRYAIAFVGLAVPGDAGAIAMNVRYMQKLGVSASAAVAQGPLLVIVSKTFDLILLALSARFLGEGVDLHDVSTGPLFRLLVWVVVGVSIGLVVMFLVPKIRNLVVPPVKEALGAIKESVTDPRRLLRIAGGTLIQKIFFAVTLSASVTAYGGALNFGQALSVNVAASLLVGLVPIAGGVGVGEAALTAGLTAVGVPAQVAAAAAITHRLVTSYLPPVFGFFASRWLTEHEYL